MTTTATLNGVALASAVTGARILAVRRPLLGDRRDVRVNIPGRAGTWTFPEEPGDRVVGLTVDIEAATFAARRAAVRNLAAWCDVGAKSQLILDDEADRYYLALVNAGEGLLERLLEAAVELPFTVDPYAYAIASSTESLTASANPTSSSFTATDDLTAEPVIQLTPAGGDLSSWSLTLNGDTLAWSGTLTSGNTITINCISETVTTGVSTDTDLTGAFNPALVDMVDVSGTFPIIIPGTNNWQLEWTGTATSVAIDVAWRERFY